MNKIKVLIVDDSAVMRKLLASLLKSDPAIEVVGTAGDAFIARDKIKLLNPDVLTLDIEMPKMDGITFLKNLMRLHPMPVVMVSSITQNGAAATMRALDLGAVDFFPKPRIKDGDSLEGCTVELTSKIKAAAMVPIHLLAKIAKNTDTTIKESNIPNIINQASNSPRKAANDKIIAIGSSTGGTEAVKEVLLNLPPTCPPIVIAQHIPPVFSLSFANRMDACSKLSVFEAVDDQIMYPGEAYIAPGDKHLEVIRKNAQYRCHLSDKDPVNRHKPSVDVLFDSVAKIAGEKAIGVILTGMGKDGAKGLKNMHDAGANTIVQDEQSSVVWGMPQAAIRLGGVDKIIPLNNIAGSLICYLSQSKNRQTGKVKKTS